MITAAPRITGRMISGSKGPIFGIPNMVGCEFRMPVTAITNPTMNTTAFTGLKLCLAGVSAFTGSGLWSS